MISTDWLAPWALLAMLVTSTGVAGTRSEQFDASVARGLPQVVDLPLADGQMQRVTVLERLHADIELPDGARAVVYAVQVDGHPATAIRTGDAVDIMLDDTEDEAPTVARRAKRSLYDWGLFDRVYPAPAGDAPRLNDDPVDADQPLRVWVFIHDQSGETNPTRFLNWYISWWIKDIENHVAPGVPVRLILRSRVPGITDLDYHAMSAEDGIAELGERGSEYAQAQGVHPGILDKYLLAVGRRGDRWDGGPLGVAVPWTSAAMFSNAGHRHIFAHEVGHLLGATHEDAESKLFCDTNMKGNILARISCRDYSEANDSRIRHYIQSRRRQP